MAIENFTLVVVLGLASIYTLISALLIFSAMSRISGKELRHLMIALFITVVSGFFYGIFQLLLQLGVIQQTIGFINYVTNFVLFTMFAMLVYLSFLTRELGRMFGFRILGKKIKTKLNAKQSRKEDSKY